MINHDQSPEDIQQRFLALKREDERTSPAFDRIWQAAAARARPRAPRVRVFLLATAGALAACGVLAGIFVDRQLSQQPARNQVVASTTMVFQWESPTSVLLTAPGEDLFPAMPQDGQWKTRFQPSKSPIPN
jgi:hypothetical protein